MEKTPRPGHGDGLGISNSYEDADSALFSGVRFMLAGFDPAARVRLREELETHGGHNLDQYDHSCTHVIVAQQVAYDDPICIAARKGGKSLATETWVSDCLNMGVSLDVNSVLYTPPKDRNGIPGSKSLCICLTGYQGQARQEIMRMVELIGAKFTKPLIASKVTHLICYKFEGDKYLLAKRMGLIKLVNHRWLEDCLKAWKLLPEDKYLRSGWELELAEAEAKDSEDSENIKGDPELLSATNGPLEINRHFPSINSEATTQQGDLELYSVSKAPVEVNGRFPSINSEASIPQTTLENNVNALGNGAPEAQSRAVELAGSQEVKKFLGGPDVKTLKADCHLESTSRKLDIGAAQLGHMANEIKNGEPNKWVEQGYENGNGNNARDLNPTCSNKDVGTGQDDMLSVGHGANQLDIQNLGQSEVHTPGIAAFEVTNENSNTKKRKYNLSVGGIVQTMEGLTPSRAGKKDGSSALKSSSRVKRSLGTGDQHQVESQHQETPIEIEPKDIGFPIDLEAHPVHLQHEINQSDLALQPELMPMPVSNSGDMPPISMDISKEPNPITPSVHNDPGEANMIDEQATELSAKDKIEKDKICSPKRKDRSNMNCVKSDTSNRSKTRKKQIINGMSPITGEKSQAPVNEVVSPAKENYSDNWDTKSLERPDSSKHKRGTRSYSENENVKTISKHIVCEQKRLESALEECVEGNGKNLPSPKVDGSNLPIKLSKKAQTETDLVKVADLDKELSQSAATAKVVKKSKGPYSRSCSSRSKASSTLQQRSSSNEIPVDGNPQDICNMSNLAAKPNNLIDTSCTRKTLSTSLSPDKPFDSASVDKEPKQPKTTYSRNRKKCKTQVDVASVNEAVLNVTSLQGGQGEIPVNGNPQDICNISNLAAKPNNLMDTSCTRKALSTPLSPDMPLDSATDDKKPKQPKSTYSRTRKKCKTQDDVARVNKTVVNNTSLQAEQSKADVSPDKSLDSPTVDKTPRQRKGTDSRNRKNSKTDVDVASVNKTLNDKLHCEQSKEDEKPVKRSQEYWFALTGHTHEREKFQGIIKRLGGHICRDQHQWKDRATHFVFPAPLRRTEKFFAAASAGRWILTAEYLDASNKAGKFVNEEDYEWHGSGFNEGKTISLEAPRKWRVLRQKSGCGAFFRLKVIVYGECLISPMDTLKRAIKAGGGAVTATSPPYTRPLSVGVDYAIISLGIPEDDPWILQFVKHQVACVREEYFLDYVCKPTSPLDNHILYNTKKNAEAAQRRLKERIEACSSMVRDMKSGLGHSDEDTACDACGRIDREEVMLLCGDGHGKGCGRAMHIDCCRPPLKRVPKDDWFCSQCKSS